MDTIRRFAVFLAISVSGVTAPGRASAQGAPPSPGAPPVAPGQAPPTPPPARPVPPSPPGPPASPGGPTPPPAPAAAPVPPPRPTQPAPGTATAAPAPPGAPAPAPAPVAPPPANPPPPSAGGWPTGAPGYAPAAQAPAAPGYAPAAQAPAAPGYAPAAQAPAPPPPEEDHGSWYEALDLSAFVDAYGSVNFNRGKPQGNANAFHAFDRSAGFALSWAGLDVAYSAEEVGATVDLRFGPSASVLAGQDTADGLQFVKQAYATWRPRFLRGHVSFDFGKFDTIYGVEVADSQKNVNYTRGFLYTLAQPHFHTGLRATYSNEGFFASALVVNGWNDSVDKNFGKGLGFDLGYSLKRSSGTGNLLTIKAGYLLSPESIDYFAGKQCDPGTVVPPTGNACVTPNPVQGPDVYTEDRGDADTQNLRHFADLAVLFEPVEELLLTLNADFGYDSHANQTNPGIVTQNSEWVGASLAGRYRLNDVWAFGLRGEYLADGNGFLCNNAESVVWINNGVPIAHGACEAAFLARGVTPSYDSGTSNTVGFASGTATIEVAPVAHLLIRLDGRYDHASELVFPVIRTKTADQVMTTLGVVATTD